MFQSQKFSKKLNAWYRKNARDLPWRQSNDPYHIWISEVMLQQTTVATVIPYYNRWIQNFPSIKHVSKAPIERILNEWKGLGYYRRAKNLHRCAKTLVEKYHAQLPSTFKKLIALPGFGPYTTGAVLSIAFNKRFPIIDTNVRRVVMRILNIHQEQQNFSDKDIYAFLDKVMPQKNNRIFNQALMELGALVCQSRCPCCKSCPLKNQCLAYKNNTQEYIPLKVKKIIQPITVVIALIKKGQKVYIQKRPSKGLWADFWEFPGGKVEAGESLKQALEREIQEECHVTIEDIELFAKVQHAYTQYRVSLYAYFCSTQTNLVEDDVHKWVKIKELTKFPMPSGNVKIIAKLSKVLS